MNSSGFTSHSNLKKYFWVTIKIMVLCMVTPIFSQTIPSISYSQTTYSLGKNRTTTISSPNNSGGVIPSGYCNGVTTYTGSVGVSGATNGTLAQATFSNPYGMVFLASGDMLIADSANHVIRKITPQGVVSTFAGTAGVSGTTNGTLTAAKFNGPSDIVQDNSGTIYVSETGNHLIRKITTAGVVSTLAGTGTSGSTNGTGTAASFNSPRQLAVDGSGNVYVTDYGNHLIRKITPAGLVTTLAGTAGVSGATDGTGTAAKFNAPFGIAVDSNNNVLVSDYNNSTIRKISPAAVVTTIAGAAGVIGDTDGSGLIARFDHPIGIVVDGTNNLYVIDKNNRLVRRITATGVVSTIAGTAGVQSSTNGIGTEATFNDLRGIALDVEEAIYVSDVTDQLIRKIQQVGYGISPALPAGLNLNTDGSISGTPTVEQAPQAYTLTATNVDGSSTATITIAVIAAPIISYATPKAFGTGSSISPLQVVNTGGAVPTGLSGMVSTFAGSGAVGSTDGVGTAATFFAASGITVDTSGNFYVTNSGSNKIRKISPAGVVTTLAGSGTAGSTNGTGAAASFNNPQDLAVDALGNVYVADSNNNKIRKISPAGVVTTLAGSGSEGDTNGTGVAASFYYPQGVAVDAAGNVYVADGSNKIRKITPAGVVTTLAGSGTSGSTDGTGVAASFGSPSGITIDASSNVYVADTNNNKIRKISPTGVVTTLAGSGTQGSTDGTGTAASFNYPNGVTVDASGNIYVADTFNNKIRKISQSGVVTTFAGSGTYGSTDGTVTAASFKYPNGVAVDPLGNLYVVDSGNNKIRKIALLGYSVSPALPAGLVLNADGSISGTPTDVSAATTYTLTATNADGSSSFAISIAITLPLTATVSQTNDSATVTPSGGTVPYTYSWSPNGGATATASGLSKGTYVCTITDALNNAITKSFNIIGIAPIISYTTPNVFVVNAAITPLQVTNTGGTVPTGSSFVTTFAGSGATGSNDGTTTDARFYTPFGITIDASGNFYITNTGNHTIRKITPAGVVTTLAGSGNMGSTDGTGVAASFSFPNGVAVDALGNVYVADTNNHKIRKISPAGVVTTLAGSGNMGSTDGTGAEASFSFPNGVAVDALGNVYVADSSNNKIRKISPAGVVTSFAGSGTFGSIDGTGTAAGFSRPLGITMDASNNLYVTDSNGNKIRKISPAGVVTTLAGSGTSGSTDGTGSSASFNYPNGITVDALGNVYVADSSNNKIRKISPAGVVTSFAGSGYGSTDGTGAVACFKTPLGVAVDTSGNVYVADTYNDKIRKIVFTGYAVSPDLPAGLVLNTDGSISGTPTVVSAATTYTITASNASGSSTTTVSIAITLPLTATVSQTNDSATVTPSGGTTPYTYSWSPSGGTTATASGLSLGTYVCTITDALNKTITKSFNIIGIAPVISYTTSNVFVVNAAIAPLQVTNTGGSIPTGSSFVTTFAGSGTPGSNNGTSTAASFNYPTSLVVDASGNLYVADRLNNRIRKITQAGVVTTFAGSGASSSTDGVGTASGFYSPTGITMDASNNLYVADRNNNKIRKITPAGVVTTLAGSGIQGSIDDTGVAASFNNPYGITVDASSNLYVADTGNNKIRKISSEGLVTTFAGSGTSDSTDGTGIAASFKEPTGLAIDASGNLYVVEGSNKIRKISPAGVVTTFAGSGNIGSTNGTGVAASFSYPNGVTVDALGNVYVADTSNNKIRKISPAGVVTTFAGIGYGSTDGTGAAARFNYPNGVAVDISGNVYVADTQNHKIRKIVFTGYTVSPDLPAGLVLNADGSISGTPSATNAATTYTITASNASGSGSKTISIAVTSPLTATDTQTNDSATVTPSGGTEPYTYSWSPSGGTTATASGLSTGTYVCTITDALNNTITKNFNIIGIAPVISYTTSNVFVVNAAIAPLQVTNTGSAVPTGVSVVTSFAGSGTPGSSDGTGTAASFYASRGIALDASGNFYVADSGNYIIRKITPTGVVTTLAGSGEFGSTDGIGTAASFGFLSGIAVDASSNLYVADMNNNKIRKITPEGVVSTFAGNDNAGSTDGTGAAASFYNPYGITVDVSGNFYVVDTGNNKIRKITPAGVVTTFAGSGTYGSTDGTGTAANFGRPQGITVDASGNLYVTDNNSNKIRKISPAGVVTTLAGSGTFGSTDGTGVAASFRYPYGIAVDQLSNVYVVDTHNHKIRKITQAGVVTTLAGSGNIGSTDGTGVVASFNYPNGVAVDTSGNVYVADSNKIRKIALSGYTVSPALPAGLDLNSDGSISGTPTVASAATAYTITAINASGSSSKTISIAVINTVPTWTGTQWINGIASTTAPAIIEGNYTSSTHLEVGELTIKNNATVVFQSGHNLTINGKLTVETGSTLTMESNANLVQTTNVANSGVISIKRKTAPLKLLDYVLWSSPVAGQQLQSYSPSTLSNRFYTYNSGTDLYTAVTTPATDAFAAGTGYLIRMPNDHPTTPTIWTGTFTGIPTNGTVNLSVTNGTYNAIGNPYPSTIVADAFIDANGITEALYFWRKTNNSANPSYATYTKAGGVGTANSADPLGLIPNGVIQVGQGFIAKATSTAIGFTNAMRTANNGNQFLRTKNTDKSRIWLNLTNDSGFFSQALVAYMDGATSGIDAAIDGRYFNDSQTALTSIINNEEFTIQGRALPFDTSDLVPLGFKAETAGDFTLAIDHVDGLFGASQKVFLKDNLTNTVNEISTANYKFSSDAGVFNNRFALVYQKTLGINHADLPANQILAYKQNDKIKIDAGTLMITGVKVYDINGRLLAERKNVNAKTALIAVNETTQVLLVHISTQQGTIVIKKIIQ